MTNYESKLKDFFSQELGKVTFHEMRMLQKNIENMVMVGSMGHGIKHNDKMVNHQTIIKGYEGVLREFLENTMKQLNKVDHKIHLNKVSNIYTDFLIAVRRTEYILSEVDKEIVKENNSIKKEKDKKHYKIKDLSLNQFNINVVFNCKDKLYGNMIAEVNKHRENQPVDYIIIHKLVDILLTLQNVYKSIYEESHSPAFNNLISTMLEEIKSIHLNNKATYYRKGFVANEYIIFVDNMIKSEIELMHKLLQNVPGHIREDYVSADVKHALYHLYMGGTLAQITKTIDLREQIETETFGNYAKIYDIVVCDKSGEAKNFLQEHYYNIIKELVKSTIENIDPKQSPDDPFLLISTLIELYRNIKYLIIQTTKEDETFFDKQIHAFTEFIDSNDTKLNISYQLAKYCETILSSGKFTEGDMEVRLRHVLMIFDLITEKDIFLHYLQKLIGARLINTQYTENSVETVFINELKNKYGREYCRKIDSMYKDIVISQTTNENFRNSEHFDPKLDLSVKLLTSSMWTIREEQQACTVPPELKESFERFAKFYNEVGSTKKKLTCLYQYSKCTVKTSYLKIKYTIQMTAFQAFILLLFNADWSSLSINQISTMTGLPVDILESALYGLVKTGILTCKDETNYSVNYQMKQKKLAFSCIMQMPKAAKETASAITAQITKDIETDRKYKTDAAIVRIMKRGKTMDHQSLLAEVISSDQLRMFTPTVSMVKDCIESLIDKEYLKRVRVDNKNAYEYIS